MDFIAILDKLSTMTDAEDLHQMTLVLQEDGEVDLDNTSGDVEMVYVIRTLQSVYDADLPTVNQVSIMRNALQGFYDRLGDFIDSLDKIVQQEDPSYWGPGDAA